jgi:hypothetical protein
MFTGWVELFRSRFSSKREFVSLDAIQQSDVKNFELVKIAQSPLRAPESAFTSPVSPNSKFDDSEFDVYRRSVTTPDYFTKEAQRDYQTPNQSFSTPRAPSRVEWDPRATHARGGLALHPIDDDDDDIGMKHKF